MFLKVIRNKKSSFSVFFIIVASAFVMIFSIVYREYTKISYYTEVKRYLEVASEDLLSEFDEKLFSNYGILAYRAQNSLEKISDAVNKNILENCSTDVERTKKSKILNDGSLSYDVTSNMKDGQKVANICVNIAKTHIPKNIVSDVLKIYDIKSKIKDSGFDKLDKFSKKIESIQDKIQNYYSLISDINDLNGYDEDWFYEVDEARAFYKLSNLDRKYKRAIRHIKDIKTRTKAIDRDYKLLKNEISKHNDMDIDFGNLEYHKNDYKKVFSKYGDVEIKQLISDLNYNHKIVRDIIKSEQIQDIDELNVDFYNADDESHSNWISVLKDKISSIDFGFADDTSFFVIPIKSINAGSVNLNLYESVLLNEYILSSFKAFVNSDTRDYPFLNRDERASIFDNGEVEYIITGKLNSKKTIKIEILGIRTVCNAISIMKSQKRMKISQDIGTLVGTFIPGGAASGTILTISLWSAIESYSDVSDIYDNKAVKFIKGDSEWRYDIDFENKRILKKDFNNIKSKNDFLGEYSCMYYNDYLRMLLLGVNNSKKVSRILSVINANESEFRSEDFKLDSYVMSHSIRCGKFEIVGDYDIDL